MLRWIARWLAVAGLVLGTATVAPSASAACAWLVGVRPTGAQRAEGPLGTTTMFTFEVVTRRDASGCPGPLFDGSLGYHTADAPTADRATAGEDYQPVRQAPVSWGTGRPAVFTVGVPVFGDLVREPDESFWLVLDAAGPILVQQPVAAAQIRNDDPAWQTSLVGRNSMPWCVPGGPCQLVIDQDLATTTTTLLRVRSVDGTAIAGADYAAVDSQLTIPAGARSVSVPLVILPDSGVPDSDEEFYLRTDVLAPGGVPEVWTTVLIRASASRGAFAAR
jgi:hypothetical protein